MSPVLLLALLAVGLGASLARAWLEAVRRDRRERASYRRGLEEGGMAPLSDRERAAALELVNDVRRRTGACR